MWEDLAPMNYLCLITFRRILLAGILWLGLATWAYGASLDEVKSRLQLARENLRISEATEARIAFELEKLKNSGTASPEVLRDYEAYLARAREMVAENRKMVKEMAVAYAKLAPPRQPASSSTTGKEGNITDPRIPDEEELDEKASLEREFNDSLAAFDEMLLKKWDEILSRSAEEMSDLSEEVGKKEGRFGEETEEETSSGEGASGTREGTADTGKGEMPSEETTETRKTAGKSGESESKGEEKGQTVTQKQRRTYDGHDDDIVARQLREAAENETDPELREKLWREYEDYKGKVESEENP
jgi:hypothetical protein